MFEQDQWPFFSSSFLFSTMTAEQGRDASTDQSTQGPLTSGATKFAV